MSARVNAYLVVLERDVTAEQAEHVANILGLLAGVVTVVPQEIDTLRDVAARHQLRHAILMHLLKAVKELPE